MSYIVKVTISCDEPTCTATIIVARTNKGGLAATLAALIARRRGWRVKGHETRTSAKVAFCSLHA